MEAVVVKVDGKGRIVIPHDIRRRLNIGRRVLLRVEDGRIVVEPLRDPLDDVAALVVDSKVVASTEPGKVSRIAERELSKTVERR